MLFEMVFDEFTNIDHQFPWIKQVNIRASIQGKIDLMPGIGAILAYFFNNGQRIWAHERVRRIAAHHQGMERKCFIFNDFTKSRKVARAHGAHQILESVAVVYPRLIVASELPAETKLEQAKTTIIYSQNRFTKDIISDNIYRLPMPAEVKTFDLKNVLKAHFFYSPSDFEILFSENDPDVVLYHEFDKPFETNKAQIRLIEHVCSTYYNDDLNEALPLYHLGSKAIAYESYQLAYTPELINDIFGEKVGVELLLEGKFTHSETGI